MPLPISGCGLTEEKTCTLLRQGFGGHSGEQSHAVKSGGESGRRLLAVVNDHRPRQLRLTVSQSKAAQAQAVQEEQQER